MSWLKDIFSASTADVNIQSAKGTSLIAWNSNGVVVARIVGNSVENNGLELVSCNRDGVTITNHGEYVRVSGHCAGSLTLNGQVSANNVSATGSIILNG